MSAINLWWGSGYSSELARQFGSRKGKCIILFTRKQGDIIYGNKINGMQALKKLPQQLVLLSQFFLPAGIEIFFQSGFLIIIKALECRYPVLLLHGFYIKHFTVNPDLFSRLDPLNFMIGEGDTMQSLLFHPLFHPMADGLLPHTK